MNGLGILAALAAESRVLGSAHQGPDGAARLADGSLLVLSGVGPGAAGAGAQRLIAAGAKALISWGMAGGLDPALAAGTVVVPHEVVSPGGTVFASEPRWQASLATMVAARQPVCGGRLLSCAAPLPSIAAKADAFSRTAAVAVDMESAAVAEVARLARVPFLAVRAIVDTAADSVPQSALAAATAGSGALRLGRVLAGLARTPGDIAPLLRLAGRYRSALRALALVARSGALTPPTWPAATRSALA